MSPPSEAEQDAMLAALSGTVTERKPETDLDRDLLRLRLIAGAQQAGVSWNVIGRVYGVSGKEIKRQAKALARSAQARLLAAGSPKPALREAARRRGR